MDNLQYISSLLAPYEPQVPVDELVDQLNRLFHDREAAVYDRQHPEIHDQLGPVWSHMLQVGLPLQSDHPLRVLDFGCGTGFESKLLLESDVCKRIGELVCYDLSPEMVEKCRAAVGTSKIPVRFLSDIDELMRSSEPFDVLITNALLHHLSDPMSTIESLAPILSHGAVWLSGHEPSSRFYKNEHCREIFTDYQRSHRFSRLLSPNRYVAAVRRLLRPDADPAEGTSRAALRAGLVKKRLPRGVIYRVVDFHVPHTPEEAAAGRGLDFNELAKQNRQRWDLVWKTSYNFMGPVLEVDLPAKWRSQCRLLKERFPDDGASFCAVWSRATAP